jgi:hypothetical protein
LPEIAGLSAIKLIGDVFPRCESVMLNDSVVTVVAENDIVELHAAQYLAQRHATIKQNTVEVKDIIGKEHSTHPSVMYKLFK